jgi:hypothetical protein
VRHRGSIDVTVGERANLVRAYQRGSGEKFAMALNSDWRKSQRSGHGECVEVRRDESGEVQVRDSKDPLGPRLGFGPDAWRDFLDGVRRGDFARPAERPDPPAA